MRISASIGFTFLYLIALCRPIAPLIEYYANKDFFATVLCINKEKPEMMCNGQCILMQKLKKSVQQESSPAPVPKVNIEEYPVSIIPSLKSHPSQFYTAVTFGYTSYTNNYRSISGTDLFHPPRPLQPYS